MKKALYLNSAQLKTELGKCLHCAKQPCHTGCPAGCNPSEFINLALAGNWMEAGYSILRSNPLGQTCGLVCPDKFCMKNCTRKNLDYAINIPKVQAAILEKLRTNAEFKLKHAVKLNGKKVAVVGAGPAGIAAAALLAGRGYSVSLFEKEGCIGGAMNLIPESRLPHSVVEQDWQFIRVIGDIDLKLKTKVNSFSELLSSGYDGVVAAVGESEGVKMGIEGEDLTTSYLDYLRKPEDFASAGRVAVIGGGAVAVDCAVTAAQNGASHVEMFVRRRFSDMRITAEERSWLLENNIDITTMTRVCALSQSDKGCLELQTIKTCFNQEGRLEDIAGTKIIRSGFDRVVMAVGSRSGEKERNDKIVYAGDCLLGSSTVVEAVASGKNAGDRMDRILRGEVCNDEDLTGAIKSTICLKVG